MSRSLRHIALTVEQRADGYAWLIFESAGGKLLVVERATRACRTYAQALQAGYEQLALLSACGLHERGIARGTAAPGIGRELVELEG